MGFSGILGHEFVGWVDRSTDPTFIGKRVVGEINAACGQCGWCAQGLGRHCPHRTTLGMVNHDGCMADIVVEATGTGSGIVQVMVLCRPRRTIIFKSTGAIQGDVNLAPVVIREQRDNSWHHQ